MTENIRTTTKLNFVVGEPGVGKSTRLLQDAIDLSVKGIPLTIITPTHSAKDNLRNMVDKRLSEHRSEEEVRALLSIRYNIHVLTNSYRGEQAILIDEISMVDSITLYSILYQSLNVKNSVITAYGDIKQIPSIVGNSPIEQVLRVNLGNQPLWDWVNEAYENVDFTTLTPPERWYLSEDIGFEVLTKNYRLSDKGYSGYNSIYLEDIIDNAIDHSATHTGYQSTIVNLNKEGYLIISPTHDRGNEVNTYLKEVYKDDFIKVAPFLINDKKVHLNPLATDYLLNKERFQFLDDLPRGSNMSKYEPTAYIVVNVAQGSTVNHAAYYFGDVPIPSNKDSFYTRNQIYTAVTRSRNSAVVIGNKHEIKKQLDNVPQSAQDKLEYKVADETTLELFSQLSGATSTTPLPFTTIRDKYNDLFNKKSETAMENDSDIFVYNINSIPRTERELQLAFKGYKVGDNGIDYKELVYKEYIRAINALKPKSGNGRVQKWVASLDDKELYQVAYDTLHLSQRNFKAKYNRDKRSTVSALNNL